MINDTFEIAYFFGDDYDEYYDYDDEYYGHTTSETTSGPSSVNLGKCAVCGILAGIIISLLICLLLKRKMNTARAAREADVYVEPGQTRITERRDMYLHTTVTRVPIPKKGGKR